jgi:adenylosuccinate synthase
MRWPELGNTCVVGLQWGDEGKGKVVDALVDRFNLVVRYSGGANAGHTVVVGGEKFTLHQLPSGILRPDVTSIIACGSVIDPALLLGEIESLTSRGVAVGSNLRISDRAHLVFPYHRKQDALAELAAPPETRLGTTGRGIGPCYADKVSRRWGIRVCELYQPRRFERRLAEIVAHKNAYLAALYDLREPFDARAIAREYLAFAERMRPWVCDTSVLLNELLRSGRRALFEGAQGSLLDIDHGTWPYVTSSSSGVGGVVSGAGVPPTAIQTVIGVVKAYCTRVGEGPLPTELKDATGQYLRERGGEYGTTTGRPRRCGWFDAVATSYAALTSGPTWLAVMHLDTLSGLEQIRVCTAYRHGSQRLNGFPADTYTLAEVEPVYQSLAGWTEEIGGCRSWEELPPAAQQYLELISRRVGAPLLMVGVGAGRESLILPACEE